MRIIADKEGKTAINQLCDIALKAGGIANLNGITQILASTIEEKAPVIPTEPPPGPENKNPIVLKNQKLNEKK